MSTAAVLKQAMAGRQLVEFDFGRDHRIVEPHVLGLKAGAEHLLAYQVGGTTSRGSTAGWRTFAVAEIGNVRPVAQTFLGPRNWGARHIAFDTILAVVS